MVRRVLGRRVDVSGRCVASWAGVSTSWAGASRLGQAPSGHWPHWLNLKCVFIFFAIQGDAFWQRTLKAHASTVNLDLSHRNINDRGAYTIAHFIENNPYLKVLDVSENHITGRGLAFIAQALCRNRVLRELDVSCNPLSDGLGLMDFCKQVGVFNNKLSLLSLRMCRLNGYHCYALSELIRHSRSITRLDLSFNEFGVLGGELLINSISKNFNLLEVLLDACRMDTEATTDISTHLKSNKAEKHRDLTKRPAFK